MLTWIRYNGSDISIWYVPPEVVGVNCFFRQLEPYRFNSLFYFLADSYCHHRKTKIGFQYLYLFNSLSMKVKYLS